MNEAIAAVIKAWGILHAELSEDAEFNHEFGQDGEPECPLCNALFEMEMAVARLPRLNTYPPEHCPAQAKPE